MSNARLHIITSDELLSLARPISTHLDDNEVDAFIEECEDVFIIPAIGYGNIKKAIEDNSWGSAIGSEFNAETFLSGGEYKRKLEPCGCAQNEENEEIAYCVGVKKALAYFVYAKMERADGAIIERSGFMRHNDQYGDHVGDSQPTEKNKQYGDTMQIAEKYLADCLAYIDNFKVVGSQPTKPIHTSRARISAIG